MKLKKYVLLLFTFLFEVICSLYNSFIIYQYENFHPLSTIKMFRNYIEKIKRILK